MALPLILVNATGGSDTAASGAGPATALTGSAGVSAADGLSVILDGSPDLSGVATDGSHVLFYNDATAGNRNFVKITNTANSGSPTATVTVANALGTVLTKGWAIGGKRSAIGTTLSTKLFSNNSAAGDAMPGWAVEMQSGHTETIAATYVLRRAGDTTSGPIIIRGTLGAATPPIVTFSNNATGFNPIAIGQVLRDFEIQNTNGTKTGSIAIYVTNILPLVERMKINNSTNKFWKGVQGTSSIVVLGCEIGNTASDGITCVQPSVIVGNWIHSCGGHGINSSAVQDRIVGNLITGCTGDGIHLTDASAVGTISRGAYISHNTIDSCTSDGIEVVASNASFDIFTGLIIENNILSNNTAYGLNFSGASVIQATIDNNGAKIRGNVYYLNGTNPIFPTTVSDEWPTTTNPTFTNAGGNDYSVGTNMKAAGYPSVASRTVGITSATNSYVDPGCAERQEPSGGGGVSHYAGDGGGFAG